jgi:hypothetical protein
MGKFTKTLLRGVTETANYLTGEIESSGLSCSLVEQDVEVISGVTVIVRVFEKYYMRNNSRASLTLAVVGTEDECHVTAIGSGGGESALFSFDWGAGDNFVSVVENALLSF